MSIIFSATPAPPYNLFVSDAVDSRRVRELPSNVSALDGIRGLAILQVVLGHLHYSVSTDPYFLDVTPWSFVNRSLEPAFLGVDVFFTLSGFLITSLLLRDLSSRRTNRSSIPSLLKRFYARRALRLLPALYVLVAISWVVVLWEGSPLASQWETTGAALLYVTNWHLVVGPLFTEFGPNGDIGHLWSLAIEEQFYIVWPLVLIGLLTLRTRPRALLVIFAVLVALIGVHRIHVFDTSSTWVGAYVRTDTRIDSMIVGAFFAVVYRHYRPHPRVVSILATVGLVGILWIKYAIPHSPEIFRSGFTVIAICTGVCVLAGAQGDWVFSRVLTWRPLVSLGKVSYGLYLYHHLVFIVVGRHVTSGPNSVRIVLAVAAAAVLTWASWRFVEQPFLRLKDRRFASNGATTSDSVAI